MTSGQEVLRIFWPVDTLRSVKQGVVVGWKNSDTDIVVVSVLEDVEACRDNHFIPLLIVD